MPRRDRDHDDDFGDDRPRPKRKGNAGLIIGLAIAGGLLLLLIAGAAAVGIYFLGKRNAGPNGGPVAAQAAVPAGGHAEPAPAEVPPGKRVWSRNDFAVAVEGKTKDEVIAAVGRPDETKESVNDPLIIRGNAKFAPREIERLYDWWLFRDRVMNAITGKPYARVLVRFDGNKADKVIYE